MRSHEFSSEDLALLRNNPLIRTVSPAGRIYYTEAFIADALQRNKQGYQARETFLDAGIPLHHFANFYPKKMLQLWESRQKEAQKRGERRKGRPKKAPDSPEERLRYLEAEVTYLKAENAFLAQLRAQRAE